jgi:type 1 fimbria pilin
MNCLLLVLLGTFSLAVTNRSYGQDTNASLSGTVVDPSNAIVPGANLTLINEATAYQQKATSNSVG